MRAAHLLLDDEPKILRDDLALGLSGLENEATLRAVLEGLLSKVAQNTTPEFAQSFVRNLRAEVAWRSRYVEDELAKALQRGVTQYVILGAGLDSFAYRKREVAKVVRVFEVDHPATQHWKRARLHALNVEIPSNVAFVPLDFEQQTLREGLRASSYRLEEPGFFSWLAVTAYLTEDAIFSTLRDIASMAAGTEVIFHYVVPDSMLDAEDRRPGAVLKMIVTEERELLLTFFDPASLRARVQALGFTAIEDFGPEDANTRYFAGRRDGLRAFPAHHLMKAQVSSSA